jgi:hypothetical protein
MDLLSVSLDDLLEEESEDIHLYFATGVRILKKLAFGSRGSEVESSKPNSGGLPELKTSA